MRSANSLYAPPSVTRFKEKLIPKLIDETKRDVIKKIKTRSSKICLNIDLWSSKFGHSFITVNASFFCEMTLEHFCLGSNVFAHPHTYLRVYEIVTEILKDHDLLVSEVYSR